MSAQKKTSTLRIIAIVAILVITALAIFIFPKLYYKFIADNVNVKEKTYLYVPSNASFQQIKDSLSAKSILKKPEYFYDLATERQLATKFKPGKYAITPGMNNRAIINMLIAGNQEPVQVSFRNLRLKENFVASVSKKLEFDSVSLSQLLDSAAFVKEYGFTKDNIYTMFSYKSFYNTSGFADSLGQYKNLFIDYIPVFGGFLFRCLV